MFGIVASLLPVELQGSAGHAHYLNGHYAALQVERNLSLELALDHPRRKLKKMMMMRWVAVLQCHFHLAERWSWLSRVDGVALKRVVEGHLMKEAGLRGTALEAHPTRRLGCGPVECGSTGLLGRAPEQM